MRSPGCAVSDRVRKVADTV